MRTCSETEPSPGRQHVVRDGFYVWLRLDRQSCRLRVDGEESARWLRERLCDIGFDCSAVEPFGETAFCIFRVSPADDIAIARLRSAIRGFSGLEAFLDPT